MVGSEVLKKIRKLLSGVLFVTAFMTFSLGIYLDAHFASNSPKIAQTQTGQVYQTSLHHGAVVYLTKQELFLIQALNPTAIGCILLGIILNPPKLVRGGKWNP